MAHRLLTGCGANYSCVSNPNVQGPGVQVGVGRQEHRGRDGARLWLLRLLLSLPPVSISEGPAEGCSLCRASQALPRAGLRRPVERGATPRWDTKRAEVM